MKAKDAKTKEIEGKNRIKSLKNRGDESQSQRCENQGD